MLRRFFEDNTLFPEGSGRSERAVSPLLLRILAVNMLALGILVGGILYLGNYQDHMVETELKEMTTQARIVASAIAENAIVVDRHDQRILSPLLGRMMVRRLAESTENRTRLFSASETMLADSRHLLAGRNAKTLSEDVAVEDQPGWGARIIAAIFDAIDLARDRRSYPAFNEDAKQKGNPLNVTSKALKGEDATQVWRLSKGGLILAVAVPVESAHRVMGAVMMSRTDVSINKAVYSVRMNILQIFFMTLCVTILLSIYLSRAIANPIRKLAHAAEKLRRGQTKDGGVTSVSSLLRGDVIPDMTFRHDEIGDLSGVLRALTVALAKRVGDIEHFAADVAHELKNPMTSLRSAVETIERVQDHAARNKLMTIIRDDVDRMSRLVTDISSASRLDAELGRAEFASVDIGAILAQIGDYYRENEGSDQTGASVVVCGTDASLCVSGVRGRLVQVLQNLLDNALSFSPPKGVVTLSAMLNGPFVQIEVQDEGPGIPENKRDALFERFYSERPKTEKFGTHSGLGLSISKQIIEAHRGRIWGENRRDENGAIIGARFVIQIPAVEG